MAITINYNGHDIQTTETDSEEIRDTMLESIKALAPQPVFFKINARDGAAFLLINSQTSLIVFDTDPPGDDVHIEAITSDGE